MLYYIVNYHNINRTMREVVVIPILLVMYAIKFGDAETKLSVGDTMYVSAGLKRSIRSVSGSRTNRSGESTEITRCDEMTDVPTELTFITKYNYPNTTTPYYSRYTHVYGIPIVSSRSVSDAALKRACYVVKFMLADNLNIREWMYKKFGRAGVIGTFEQLTDIPEYRDLPAWINKRARGLGGSIKIPISTGSEESLLCDQRMDEYKDRYPNQDIFLHEFAHGIMNVAVFEGAIPGWIAKLRRAYKDTKMKGLWRNTYSMTSDQEYFAEGVQSFFNVNAHSDKADGVVSPVSTHDKLKEYDPTLYELIREVFPCMNTILERCANKRGDSMPAFKMNCKSDGSGGKWVRTFDGTTTANTGGKDGTPKPAVAQTTTPKPAGPCKDNDIRCASWWMASYCTDVNYKDWMTKNCKKTCALC